MCPSRVNGPLIFIISILYVGLQFLHWFVIGKRFLKWKFLNWMTAVFAEDEKQEEEKVSAWRREKNGESERCSQVSFKIIFKASFLWKVKPIFYSNVTDALEKAGFKTYPPACICKIDWWCFRSRRNRLKCISQ